MNFRTLLSKFRLYNLFFMLLIVQGGFSFAQESGKPVWGIEVGMGYGKLKSNDLSDPDFHFKPFYSKTAGITLDIPIPNLEKRGSFFNELSFSQFETTTNDRYADTTSGFPERDYYLIERKFAPNMITLTNTFRYCFTNSDFKYYISVGVYNNFIIESVNRRVTDHYVNGEVTSSTEDLIPDHAIHGIMLTAGTGITYKYAGLEFRYDPGRNFTRKVDYSIFSPVVSVLLHVRFNP